jgi:Notch-like protein
VIDDAPCACSSLEVAGVHFGVCDLPMTFDDAAAFCRARGGELARVDTEVQAHGIQVAIISGRRRNKWWIGLDDRAVEGEFRNRDGSPATFMFWDRGEPNNAGCNQDCVAVDDKENARWVDTHCLEQHPFVCSD